MNTLDSSVGAIQGYMHNHIPTHKPHYVSGYHPVDFMQICNKTKISKIPLIKYVKNSPHIYSMGGAHTFDSNGNDFAVLMDSLNIHHFNYRSYNNTYNRLRDLVKKNPDGTSRIDWMDDYAKRIHGKVQSKYHGKFMHLRNIYLDNKNIALKTKKLLYKYSNIKRWYKDLYYNNISDTSNGDILISHALYYYFNKEYLKSFNKFNEAINFIHDIDVCIWITIKLADCATYFDKNLAKQIIDRINYDYNEDMNFYINSIYNKHFS